MDQKSFEKVLAGATGPLSQMAEVAKALEASRMSFSQMDDFKTAMASLKGPFSRYAELAGLVPSLNVIDWASVRNAVVEAAEIQESTATEGPATEEDASFPVTEMPWNRPGYLDLELGDQMNQLVEAMREQTALVKEQKQSGKTIGRKDVTLVILQAVIKVMVEMLIVAFISYVHSLLSPSHPKTVVREVRTIVRDFPELIPQSRDCRIVGKKKLAAYHAPKPKSAKVGILRLGQMVRQIEKRKEWCLIEWHDDSGHACHGWVKSKYLRRI
jgi:hypothetical protein